jgi:hypothetical protein
MAGSYGLLLQLAQRTNQKMTQADQRDNLTVLKYGSGFIIMPQNNVEDYIVVVRV